MSYKAYKGIISARGGRGKEAPQSCADISEVIPVGLSPSDLIATLHAKYGDEVVARLLWNSYTSIIQKPGQLILKADPEAIDEAAHAMVNRANSNLAPQRKPAQPKLTADAFREAAKARGVSDKKINEVLADLLG